MGRSTLIVGNGIGLALDSDYFSLQSGLQHVWSNTDCLTKEHKDLIIAGIKGTTNDDYPTSEPQLDKLQVAIIAAEFLSDFEVDNKPWISEAAKNLPISFKEYIHAVSIYFHRSGKTLPQGFTTPLSTFIKETKSHVVTLNYDNLLYDALKKEGVLNGFTKGDLIDGFTARLGFDEDNLYRKYIDNLGWYMHLHGSPLFIDDKKITGEGRDHLESNQQCNIVLTHVKHKPWIINSSRILKAYWQKLEEAFEESDRIILFGYSGKDDHLNDRIKLRTKDKNLLIVEWNGSRETIEFWKNKTGFSNVELVQLDNILTFTDWQNV